MSDDLPGKISRDESSQLPHEQLEACLKNLFDVPSKNIESAFELVLGLIKEQASQIDGLKRAQEKALENNGKIRTSMQNDVDDLAREKGEMYVDFQKLKKEHAHLLQSYDETTTIVDEMKHEIEALTFNFLGDDRSHQSEDESEIDIVDDKQSSSTGEEDGVHQTQDDGDTVTETVQCDREMGVPVDSPCEEEQNHNPEIRTVDRSILAEPLLDAVNYSVYSPGEEEQSDAPKIRALGQGSSRRVSIAQVKFTKDRTVVARLDRLEQSLSSLRKRQVNDQSGVSKQSDETTLREIASRVDVVEAVLHGFVQDDETAESQQQQQQQQEATNEDGTEEATVTSESADDDNDSASQTPYPADAILQDVSLCEKSSDIENYAKPEFLPPHRSDSSQLSRRGSLLFHLNERETRTGLSIDDLAQQVCELRENMQGQQQIGPMQQIIDPEGLQKQVAELSDELKKQVAEIIVSVGDKVSNEDFEVKFEEIRSLLRGHGSGEAGEAGEAVDASSCSNANPDELTMAKKDILEKMGKLEIAKLDRDAFEQKLKQMEDDLKSSLDQEISKQQIDISTNAEKTENDLIEIKSIIDAQNDAIMQVMQLHDESPMSSDMEASIKEDDVNARIQQATDALRESLEERLDELKSIESEMDGFASKLAEKPSQDQIDSMLRDIEKRMGQDETLQVILANMKIELKQRMTRGEVMALVKQSFREAKLGVQNTKDTLMIGRIPYCLGCNVPFPAGVNGTRAPKMNHDSLPPATGLVSNATLYGAGSRRSLRPLQALRSAPQRSRPKSAILGKFSSSSAHVRVRVRNNSR